MSSDNPLHRSASPPWRRVLITGGSGFIGGHLAQAVRRHWPACELVILDLLPPAEIPDQFIQGSISDKACVMEACRGVDCVFHLAAMVSAEESLEKPHECLEVNVTGTLCLLEAACRQGVARLVFSSSAAVYGDSPTCPQNEAMKPEPLTPYGISKLDGELYLEVYRRTAGLSTVSLRYFNVYGPGQNPNSNYAAAIPRFIERARQGEPLQIFGDGLQTRDFVHVTDVARANLWAACQQELHGPCNVSTGQPIQILELASRIRDLTGSRSEIHMGPPRPGDIRDSWADPSRLSHLGYRASIPLAQGLQALIENGDSRATLHLDQNRPLKAE